jgi:hypothetical protein|tara:strand:- start:942 stop:1307 length:366 start_codon:yes stop_codon:yes gene_type:complete
MAETKPFRLSDGGVLLRGAECRACHYQWFPLQSFGCEQCGAHGDDIASRDFTGSATIYSFTPVPERDGGTFILAQLILDQGPAIRGIIDHASDGLQIGDRVDAVATGEGDEMSVVFRKVTT